MTRKVEYFVVGSLVAAVVATSGCGYLRQTRDNTPPVAVPQMIAAQTLNPEAGKNRKVVVGLDGKVAQNVSDGYAKSFERQNSQKRAVEAFTGLSGLSTN